MTYFKMFDGEDAVWSFRPDSFFVPLERVLDVVALQMLERKQEADADFLLSRRPSAACGGRRGERLAAPDLRMMFPCRK